MPYTLNLYSIICQPHLNTMEKAVSSILLNEDIKYYHIYILLYKIGLEKYSPKYYQHLSLDHKISDAFLYIVLIFMLLKTFLVGQNNSIIKRYAQNRSTEETKEGERGEKRD